MLVEMIYLNNINSLLNKVMEGKVEHLPDIKMAKELTEELIKYTDKKNLSPPSKIGSKKSTITELYQIGGINQMNNHTIRPAQLIALTRMTVDFFREVNEETKYNMGSPAKETEMHYVADLLKDLVSTSWPQADTQSQEEIEEHIHFIDVSGSKDPNILKEVIESILKQVKEGDI